MSNVTPIDQSIEREVAKMRLPIIGPIGRAIARFFEDLDRRRLARAEKRAQRIMEGHGFF